MLDAEAQQNHHSPHLCQGLVGVEVLGWCDRDMRFPLRRWWDYRLGQLPEELIFKRRCSRIN